MQRDDELKRATLETISTDSSPHVMKNRDRSFDIRVAGFSRY